MSYDFENIDLDNIIEDLIKKEIQRPNTMVIPADILPVNLVHSIDTAQVALIKAVELRCIGSIRSLGVSFEKLGEVSESVYPEVMAAMERFHNERYPKYLKEYLDKLSVISEASSVGTFKEEPYWISSNRNKGEGRPKKSGKSKHSRR